ncbi:hypothetical protein [Candidatus Merdisoma sp. JLR.KK006]|jgi:uncharacterized protein (DUF1697 family)|uniref:hypothetical protein n=1 Tax=Candidatus Merdisoma sp. JLR.KK006 TaxID=3112626 RepID=UPI002FF087D5
MKKKISLGYEDDKEVFIEEPIEEEIENLISMIREEENIYKRDRAMYDLIWEDAMHYFSKEISIEAATESIVKNYNTYLSEYSE